MLGYNTFNTLMYYANYAFYAYMLCFFILFFILKITLCHFGLKTPKKLSKGELYGPIRQSNRLVDSSGLG